MQVLQNAEAILEAEVSHLGAAGATAFLFHLYDPISI